MNSKQLNDALGQVDERHLEEASRYRKRRPWAKWAGLAAVLALAVLAAVRNGRPAKTPESGPVVLSGSVQRLAAVQRPEVVRYPDPDDYTDASGRLNDAAYEKAYDAWWQENRTRALDYSADYAEPIRAFLTESTRQFLTGAGGDNRVYAPKNAYLALAMLAETAGGETRAQLLDLLGVGDTETLRSFAKALWNINYQDDGTAKSVLAGSLWLRDGFDYVSQTLQTLAADYYADSFSGEMGSPELDRALQSWLDANTGGLLTEQANAQHLDDDIVFALATTVCFRGKWSWKFSADDNSQDVFHTPSGDVTAAFMHHEEQKTNYYWGERFAAVGQYFDNFGGMMWFLLPDEGVSIDELLADDEAMRFLTTADKWRSWDKQRFLRVNFSVPKFDVVSDLDLADGLCALGAADAFDPSRADFSALTSFSPVWVSEVRHAARVVIDEDGCTAAAFTLIPAPGEAPPPEELVNFTLDRPFLFCITGADGLPLFTGVVNRP